MDTLRILAETLLPVADAVLARVWIAGPGDLCSSCPMRAECPDRSACLHLERSAGLSARTDGPFRRFPLGARQVGRVALTGEPFVATREIGSLGLADPTWLMVHDVHGFAALPVFRGGKCIGVAAVFSRRILSDEDLNALGGLVWLAGEVLARSPSGVPDHRSGSASARSSADALDVLRPYADIERDVIARVLTHTHGRVSGPRGAAKLLAMKPTTLHSRMKKLGIARGRPRT